MIEKYNNIMTTFHYIVILFIDKCKDIIYVK
jgi:hypothetical protein